MSTGNRGRGRGRRFRPRSGQINANATTRQATTQPIGRAQTSQDIVDLQPTSLVQQPTLLKNDPVELQDMMVGGLAGMAFKPCKMQFCLDYSGYVSLVESIYSDLKSVDRYWTRNVSPSLFMYYCTVIFWYRICIIRNKQGNDPSNTMASLTTLLGNMYLPLPLAQYLSGIGDVQDPNGRKWELHLITPPLDALHLGIRGFFGPVDVHSMQAYMTMPSLGVAIMRLATDVAHNADHQVPQIWDLPPALRPQDRDVQAPNVNLLCWHRAERPHADVSNMIRDMNFYVEIDNINHTIANVDLGQHQVIGGLQIKLEFMKMVSERLHANESLYKVTNSISKSLYGSNSQLGWLEFSEQQPVNVSRFIRYDTRDHFARMYHQIPTKVGNSINVFKYRTQRPLYHTSLPYQFVNNNAPADWIAHVRDVFTWGDQPTINSSEFTSAHVQGLAIVGEYTKQMITGK